MRDRYQKWDQFIACYEKSVNAEDALNKHLQKRIAKGDKAAIRHLEKRRAAKAKAKAGPKPLELWDKREIRRLERFKLEADLAALMSAQSVGKP